MKLYDKLKKSLSKKSAPPPVRTASRFEKVNPENPYLGREPITNRQKALIGYELFFYPGTEEKAAQANARFARIDTLLDADIELTFEAAAQQADAEIQDSFKDTQSQENDEHVFISEMRYALKEKLVGSSLGHHLGFIKLNSRHLNEKVSTIPPQLFPLEITLDFFIDPNPIEVIEIKETSEKEITIVSEPSIEDEELAPQPPSYKEIMLTKIDALKNAGYQFVLTGLTDIEDGLDEILKRCRYAKIDHHQVSKDKIRPLIEYCNTHLQLPIAKKSASAPKKGVVQKPVIKLIAAKVETSEDYHNAMELGFDAFQGFYFTKKDKDLSLARGDDYLKLLKLLALLLTGPSLQELIDALDDNPVVARQLIKIARIEGEKKRREVNDVHDAVNICGIKKITRWTQVLLYADGEGKVELEDSPLLESVCVRALFMEYASARINNAGNLSISDLAFLVGGLSLIENVFDLSIEEIMSHFELPHVVGDAIKTRSGVLGDLLSLAEAAEVGNLKKCRELCVNNLSEITMDAIAIDTLHAVKSFSTQVKDAPDADVWLEPEIEEEESI
jgi:c-di-GMP-related signal transduction protein